MFAETEGLEWQSMIWLLQPSLYFQANTVYLYYTNLNLAKAVFAGIHLGE